MDTPIVFATHVANSSVPIAKPIPISPVISTPVASTPVASAPPLETMYIPHTPVPRQMNRHTTVYVETRDRTDGCDDLCSILLCCCLIQSLSD
jgi:hypothetical protein